jgi:hypothetical protein
MLLLQSLLMAVLCLLLAHVQHQDAERIAAAGCFEACIAAATCC